MDPFTDGPGGNVRTARLLLRSWAYADEQPMLELSTDPEVMRCFPRPMSAAEVHSFVDQPSVEAENPLRHHVHNRLRVEQWRWSLDE